MFGNEPTWRGRISVPAGDEWLILTEMLQGLLHRVYNVTIVVRDGRAVLRGKVYSEQVRVGIQRLVALHAPTVGIDNELTWESPLYSADGGDVDEEFVWPAEAPKSDDQVKVDRHPNVRSIGDAIPGRRLDLIVDLTVDRDGYSVGQFSLDAERGWDTLDIDVVVDCDGLDIPAAKRRSVITLQSDGTSLPALISGVVTDTQEVAIRLYFAHLGIDCGFAEHVIRVEPSPTADTINPPLAAANYLAVHPGQEAPHLTVRINSSGERGACRWSFEVRPELRDRVSSDVFAFNELGETARDYFKRQFTECPELIPGRHANKLQGLGEMIWRATPAEFRELYIAIRACSGPGFPIQLVTNEPYVPWELMFPDDARVDQPSHMFCEHPVARWFERSGPRNINFAAGKRVSFVPTYEGNHALPGTLDELNWLVGQLGATAGDPTYQGFNDFLRKAQPASVQLVHFAGHGAAPGSGKHGLWFGGDDWVTDDEINSGVVLGRDHHPFFALNACQVGQSAAALGSVAGWPMALTLRGFGGVLAPLWSVEDNCASEFVQSFLTAFLIDGMGLGDAARVARKRHANTSADAHAYLFYGDVMAKAA